MGFDGTQKDLDSLGALEKENEKEDNGEKEINTGDKHLGEVEKLLNEEGLKIEELTKKAQLLQTQNNAEPSQEDQAQFNTLLDHAKAIKVIIIRKLKNELTVILVSIGQSGK